MILRNRRAALVVLLLVAVALSGCAWIKDTTKDIQEMTPKEKATWMFGVYNAQYADYIQASLLPGLTEAEKEIMRRKKDLLIMVYPLIGAYDQLQVQGKPSAPDAEAKIFGLLAQLEHLIVRKVAE
jgi:hypothetical protein